MPMAIVMKGMIWMSSFFKNIPNLHKNSSYELIRVDLTQSVSPGFFHAGYVRQ